MGINPWRVDTAQLSPLPLHSPLFSSITNPTIAFSLLFFLQGTYPSFLSQACHRLSFRWKMGRDPLACLIFPVVSTTFPSSMRSRPDPSQEIHHVSHVVADEDGGFPGTSKGGRTRVEKENATQWKGECSRVKRNHPRERTRVRTARVPRRKPLRSPTSLPGIDPQWCTKRGEVGTITDEDEGVPPGWDHRDFRFERTKLST